MIKRDFILGEEWVYYKIYCGYKTADLILINEINPLIRQLIDNQIITNWFFIRYSDPEPHIRLRLRLRDTNLLAVVLQTFKNSFRKLVDNNFAWNIQLENYSRELERYGKFNYEATELIFQYDSELVMAFLIDLYQNKNNLLNMAFSYSSIFGILEALNIPDSYRANFFKNIFYSFCQEFNVDKYQRKKMNLYFKEQRQMMTDIYNGKSSLISTEIKNQLEIRNIKIQNLRGALNLEEISQFVFVSSLIHMSINRLFTSRQREYELLIYNNLSAFQKSNSYNLA